MTYLALSLPFLAVAVAAAILARRRLALGAVGITIVLLVLLTAIFDNVMIGSGLFTYADAHLIGLRVVLAPIEDFAYPIAGALLLPALWVFLRRGREHARSEHPGDDA